MGARQKTRIRFAVSSLRDIQMMILNTTSPPRGRCLDRPLSALHYPSMPALCRKETTCPWGDLLRIPQQLWGRHDDGDDDDVHDDTLGEVIPFSNDPDFAGGDHGDDDDDNALRTEA